MVDKTPTPHIGAKLGDIAETVIMAGDPLLSLMIPSCLTMSVVCLAIRAHTKENG